jgi:hypothetical protein
MLRTEGDCLCLVTIVDNRQGPNLLPIWPPAYRATASSMGQWVYRPEDRPDFAFVAGAEPLELRGEHVDAPPSDTVTPVHCVSMRCSW